MIRSNSNSSARLLLAALLTGPGLIAAAVAADNYLERPTVASASEIFEKYPSKVTQGTLVAFKKKESKFAAKLFDAGIQARIFALGDQDSIPKPVDTKDNCNIYISYVFPLASSGTTDVVLQTLDEGWLNLTSSEKSIKDGRYFIVFEKSGPTLEQFGLRPSDAKPYFDSGFVLTVSDDGKANLAKVVSEYKLRRTKVSILRKDVDDGALNSIPCYRYTKLAQAIKPEDAVVASVALCESGANTNPLFQ